MYTFENFKISYEPKEQELPFIQEQIEKIFFALQKEKIGYHLVEEIKKNIQKFPQVSVFKGYLINAYEKLNKWDFVEPVIEKIQKEHPDYIFGNIQAAEYYFENDNTMRCQEILKNTHNINELFPDIKTFHAQEVIAYYFLIAKIELERNNTENVHQIIDLLKTVEGADTVIDFLERRLWLSREQIDRFGLIEPVTEKEMPEDGSTYIPDLENEILYEIYQYDIYSDSEVIDELFLNEILKLDRQSLIQDLKTILKDAEIRHQFFKDSFDTENFLISALLIIKEIKAVELLDDVLEVLRFSEDDLDYFLGNFISEYLWMVLYEIGQEKLQTLYNFLLEPGIWSFAKMSVSTALIQIYLHNPEKQLQISIIWEKLLHFYAQLSVENNVVSSTFFAFFVSDIYEATTPKYLPLIKTLYDKNWMDETVNGNYNEFLTHYENPEIMEILSTTEITNELDDNYYDEDEDEDIDFDEDFLND